ncbi:hypothetical protein C6A87_001475 [Mycobacterium sp. ITM-2016-00317]|jgi:hypothetical protein|uniref:hypothetical protein n=1 Tax=Mycobacterium sp. ITM-2016-00317 TaxID=2099694 RepID=UPI000D4BBC74|nr:hypothetical protein [Mycobacterium sp. ITM-2016-00317]WNG87982.1 hypothetical protein C6A87_001475 [Mycobacterium sp. ITM-2016-00317]
MLSALRRIMDYEMTVAEWIGAALLAGAPYGALGLLVALLKPDHYAHADGLYRIVAFVGSVVFWPVLFVTDVCMP